MAPSLYQQLQRIYGVRYRSTLTQYPTISDLRMPFSCCRGSWTSNKGRSSLEGRLQPRAHLQVNLKRLALSVKRRPRLQVSKIWVPRNRFTQSAAPQLSGFCGALFPINLQVFRGRLITSQNISPCIPHCAQLSLPCLSGLQEVGSLCCCQQERCNSPRIAPHLHASHGVVPGICLQGFPQRRTHRTRHTAGHASCDEVRRWQAYASLSQVR